MSQFISEEFARTQVRGQQIIIGALAMGQISFAVIAVITRLQNAPRGASSVLSYVAIGMAVIMLAIRPVLGSTSASNGRRRIASGTWDAGPQVRSNLPPEMTEGDKLLLAWRAKTTLEAAAIEGPSFFILIAYIVEGHVWVLAVAGALLTILLVPFPSYDRAENWVKYQLELLDVEKGRP